MDEEEKARVKVVYKEKKTPGKTVAIVLLTIALLGLSSYIFYTKYQEIMSDKDNEKIEVKEDSEELYYTEVEDLLKQIDDYNELLSKNYPITDFNKLDNQEKLRMGIYLLTKYENTKNYYKTDDMNDIFKRFFVSNFKVVHENITCEEQDGDLYTLNNGTYVLDNSHDHGKESFDIDTFYVESNKLDNIYKITVNILYSNYCTGTCPRVDEYYQSYNDLKEGTNKVLDSLNDYLDNKDDLAKTTFTFEKDEDGDYLLKSVKVTK